MLPRIVPIVVAAGLLLAGGIHDRQLSQAGRPATPSASLDEKLSAAVARGDVPGLVVIAATRDRILYQGVFGKAETGRERPMTADALFRIASMTKASHLSRRDATGTNKAASPSTIRRKSTCLSWQT